MNAVTSRPDFSPATLKLFLNARVIAREEFAARPQKARHAVADELMQASGLPWSDIVAAFAGRLPEADKRARLWAALGHFPADFGIVLADDGKQFLASRAGGAPAGHASRDGQSALRATPEDHGGQG